MKQEPTNEAPINDRAQHLLKVLVESYIADGQPVGSRTLSRIGGLDLSPATIRNVMSDLEEAGFVHAPHTSAGRVPTVQGYRMFIDTMLRLEPLKGSLLEEVRGSLGPDMDAGGLVESASDVLSRVTRLAGLVTLPKQEHASLRQVEFLKLSESRVLAILVMNQMEVQNRVIHLDREYTTDELQTAANYLNSRYAGNDLRTLRGRLLGELDQVRQDMDDTMRAVIDLGEKAFSNPKAGEDDFVVVGQSNLMGYEELSDVDKLKQLFDAFSEKRNILHILDQCLTADGVQIFIGNESGYGVLDDCSLVTAPYSAGDDIVGVLGVIGPTRMAYDRVIPIVDITAKLLGAALNVRD